MYKRFTDRLGQIARRLVTSLIRRRGYRALEISHPNRIGHLCIEPDCYLKEMALLGTTPKRVFLLVTEVGFANATVVGYLSKRISVVSHTGLSRFLIDCFRAAGAMVLTQSYASAMYSTARCFEIYRRWGRRAPLFQLTEADRKFGTGLLRRMGIPEGAWFVCLHAREGGYSPSDEALHSFRNMSVEDYAWAIDEITARGGWCIRMGDATMQPLRPRPQVIDYALSEFKSARMDVFLGASCRFYLGCSSGLYNVAAIFGRPAAMTNTAPISASFVYGLDDLAIPQRVRLADGRAAPFEEILELDIANFRLTEEFTNRGVTLIRVSPEDIRRLTVEMLERCDGTAAYSVEDEQRQARFKALFREGHYSYGAGSRIGRDYLTAHFRPDERVAAPSPEIAVTS